MMKLSNKQIEYKKNYNHRWNLKVGATGSGKTYMDYAYVIPKRVLNTRGEGAILLLGNTQGTIMRNVIEPMRGIYGDRFVSNLHGNNTITLFGKTCYVLGADNKKHVARIQGMTVEYAYGDEMTTWNQDVFEMLKSRLRCEHSRFDGTMNPADPGNFMKAFIDSDADVYCQNYVIDDNPFLPKEFVDNLKREYAGTVYYNRYILGQWAYAEGIIYKVFADAVQKKNNRFVWGDQDKKPFYQIVIGVDFGGNGSKHAFVATGYTHDGDIVGLLSRRIDPQKTDADYLTEEFKSFAQTVFSTWGEIKYVFCDSAEQVLIQHIRNHLLNSDMGWLSSRIYNSKKIEINDRIRLTTVLIGGGRFFYTPQAESLKEALATSMWADKKTGVDIRLDDGSTDIDTLDAFEYTIEREYRRLLKWS